jgi:hypothetical protein
MLFYKIDENCWNSLATFLVYLERMPEKVSEYGIVLSDMNLDETIIQKLREI